MSKLLDFLKTHFIIILLATLVSLLVASQFLIKKGEETGPVATPTPTTKTTPSPSSFTITPATTSLEGSWKGISPGTTSVSGLENQLGQPLKKQSEGGQMVYFYPTSTDLPSWLNEVTVSQNTVVLIKQRIVSQEAGVLNDYLNRYGKPDQIFFGPNGPFLYHVFLQAGLAVAASRDTGQILEIWYFQPTPNLQEFLQKWGDGLTLTPPSQH